MTRASVPAMTIPNFNQTTLMYERDQQNSVTITTLPAGEGRADSSLATTPATITPARITPMVPGEGDKTVAVELGMEGEVANVLLVTSGSMTRTV